MPRRRRKGPRGECGAGYGEGKEEKGNRNEEEPRRPAASGQGQDGQEDRGDQDCRESNEEISGPGFHHGRIAVLTTENPAVP